MKLPEINWVLVGTIIGIFWGIFAVLFYRPKAVWKPFLNAVQSIFIIVFQFVFQFIGAFAGAVGIGLFIDRYSQGHLGIPELILVGVSLIGVSGKLSDIIFRLPGYMSVAFKKDTEGKSAATQPGEETGGQDTESLGGC